MEYRPDCWVVIKLTNKDSETHYRVFANWIGGYLDGDSWKLNSGIEKVAIEDSIYSFIGASKSTYHCHINQYRMTGYGSSVLDAIIENSKNLVTIEILDKEQMLNIVETCFKENS